MSLANRIAVMEAGELVQQGGRGGDLRTPAHALRLHLHRRSEYVRGPALGGVVEFAGMRVPALGPDGRVTIVVRPEDVRLAPTEIAADVAFKGVLEDMVYLGAFVRYRVRLFEGLRITASTADRATRYALAVGKPVWAGWSLDDQRLIDE